MSKERAKTECPLCKKLISNSNINKHLISHERHPEYHEESFWKIKHEGLTCQFCGKLCKNLNSLTNHERLCKLNPNKQETLFDKGINPLDFPVKVCKTGALSCTSSDDRLCPHCNMWFHKSSIGGHVNKCSKLHKEDRRVVVLGDVLDITVTQLAEYMSKQVTCEICGKTADEANIYKGKYAAKRLCVDHDHETNKFRGLLCSACNRNLGWYENHKKAADKYLFNYESKEKC